MPEFSKNIKSKYNFETYEETKRAVEWIILSLKKLKLSKQQPHTDFKFNIGDIGCGCEGLEEFCSVAYGQKNYSLTDFTVSQFKNNNLYVYISFYNNREITIRTTSKNMLERVISCLNETNFASCDVPHKEDEKIRQWTVSVFQSLLANGLWVIIVAAATFAVTFLKKLW